MKRSIIFWNTILSIIFIVISYFVVKYSYNEWVYNKTFNSIINNIESNSGKYVAPNTSKLQYFVDSFSFNSDLLVIFLLLLVVEWLGIVFESILSNRKPSCYELKSINKFVRQNYFFLFFNPITYYIYFLIYICILLNRIGKLIDRFNNFLDNK